MPACLQQNIHRRVLSIRVFSAGEHYASRDQFKPIRIGENLVVNYKYI